MATKKPAPKSTAKAAPAKKTASHSAKPAAGKPAAPAKGGGAKPAAKSSAKAVPAKAPARPAASKPAPAKAAPGKGTPAKAAPSKPVAKAAPKPPAPAAKPAPAKPAPAKAAPAKGTPAKGAAKAAPAAPAGKKAPEPQKPVATKEKPSVSAPSKAEVKPSIKPLSKGGDAPKAPAKAPAKAAPARPVVIPKTSTDKSIKYEPEFTKSVLDTPQYAPSTPSMRYSDNELQEFRELINKKLETAKKELAYLQGLITRKDEGDTEEGRYMTMEDGSMSMEREQLSQMASRQIQFIDHLEKAIMRIENKTYGICRVTGKLIDKARLRAVPHATLSIEAKQMRK